MSHTSHSRMTLGNSSRLLACLAATALISLPAAAAQNSGKEICWSGSDRALSVAECLSNLSIEPAATASLALPDSVFQVLQAELMWSPSLLRTVLSHGSVRGEFTRIATLDGVETELGRDTVETLLTGDPGHIMVSIRLGGEHGQELTADYRADGHGMVRILEDGRQRRAVRFTKGLAVSDSNDRAATKSAFYMGCFIDTPAYDHYRADACFRLGNVPSQAVFKFFLPYTPEYYVWNNPAGCSGQYCARPISPGQTISAGGYWVINGIPTGPVGAQATYFYEPGGGGGGPLF